LDLIAFKNVENTQGVHVGGQLRLVPGRTNKRLCRQVIDLVGLNRFYYGDERSFIAHVARDILDPIIDAQVFERIEPRVGISSDQSIDFVALLEQQLGQIGAILSKDSGYQGSFFVHSDVYHRIEWVFLPVTWRVGCSSTDPKPAHRKADITGFSLPAISQPSDV